MNAMKYNSYVARVEYDGDDRIFVGHLAGIKDIVGFHGSSVDELETAFHASVDHYIEYSARTGRPAQKPHSGKLMLRIDPDVHAAVATAADVQGKSINKWAADVLGKAADLV